MRGWQRERRDMTCVAICGLVQVCEKAWGGNTCRQNVDSCGSVQIYFQSIRESHHNKMALPVP